MSSQTFLSFYLRSSTIRVFNAAVRSIGQPRFIRFMLNTDTMQMVMLPAYKKDFQSFLHFCDNAFAAYVLAKALKGNMLYIDTEEANFVFNGNYWVRVPSIATEAHAALTNALLVYLRKNPRDKKIVLDCIKTIGSNSFRQKLSNDLNKKQGYFYHDEKTAPILFDSHPVRETPFTILSGHLPPRER